jgi:hypothetical protein
VSGAHAAGPATRAVEHSTWRPSEDPAWTRSADGLRGPVVEARPFREAVVSWSASAPAGSQIEVRLRARVHDSWTKSYILGIWSEGATRYSVAGQRDGNGDVDVDTLRLVDDAREYQVEVALRSEPPVAAPTVRRIDVVTSRGRVPDPHVSRGDPALWGRVLDVPPRSQMKYPNGGEAWCSPTSTSMVLAYYGTQVAVPDAARETYDSAYEGCGNWPFNTAYAARFGYEAFVTRFSSLADVEPWIAAGVPIVLSYPWKPGELNGAPIPSSNGHLAVVVGFDARGNPVMNDPAAPTDDTVRRTYSRHELERVWLAGSGGAAYVIHPAGQRTPPV